VNLSTKLASIYSGRYSAKLYFKGADMNLYRLIISLLLFYPSLCFSHAGGQDENGGHFNRKTNEYHCHSASCIEKPKTEASEKSELKVKEGFLCRGQVIKVSDGDTVHFVCEGHATTIKVRLAEIDTPETKKINKPCNAQPFSEEATGMLTDRVHEKSLLLEVTAIDRYKRAVGKLFDEEGSVNHYMVRTGFAHHYKIYSTDEQLALLEDKSKLEKQGLWVNVEPCIMSPWQWRKLSKDEKCTLQKSYRERKCWAF